MNSDWCTMSLHYFCGLIRWLREHGNNGVADDLLQNVAADDAKVRFIEVRP